jgi:integrase
LSLLGYAGLRPDEALALQWRHVREGTLVEQAVSDGELKDQKTHRPPRTVDLLAPLKQTSPSGGSRPAARHTTRSCVSGHDPEPTLARPRLPQLAQAPLRSRGPAAGLPQARPYNLRHSLRA